MNTSDTQKRIQAAWQLLSDTSIFSKETFDSVQTLVKGLNPKVDKALNTCFDALSKVEKIQNGDVVSLSIDTLPEETEEQKNRKKALLFLLESLQDLKS